MKLLLSKSSALLVLSLLFFSQASAFDVIITSYARVGATNNFDFEATVSNINNAITTFEFSWLLTQGNATIASGNQSASYNPMGLPVPHVQNWIAAINRCGDYKLRVIVKGLNGNGTELEIKKAQIAFCIDQYYRNNNLTSCAPCPPSPLRTSELTSPVPTTLAVRANDRNSLLLETNSSQLTSKMMPLRLIDLNGRTIHQQILEVQAGAQTHKLALHDLPTGIYLITLETGAGIISEKIIIQ